VTMKLRMKPCRRSMPTPKGNANTEWFLSTLRGRAGLPPRVDQPDRLLLRPGPLDRRIQGRLSALGAGLPLARGIRSPTSRPIQLHGRCAQCGAVHIALLESDVVKKHPRPYCRI
jgi:hypothetical protein